MSFATASGWICKPASIFRAAPDRAARFSVCGPAFDLPPYPSTFGVPMDSNRPYQRGKAVEIKEVSKTFGNFQALKPVSFDIFENEFFTLLGPSGCGKTT